MEEIKLLKKLGMTEYEARAYLSLAKLGPSTVREIVLDSKLPRNKAYESLKRLEDKNRVVSLIASPRKYKILNSEVFRDEITDLKNSVENLIKLVEKPKVSVFKDFFWVLKGKKAIEEKLAMDNSNVKRELLACNNLSKILYKNLRSMKSAVDRGVTVKMLCTFREGREKIYREWIGTGAKIRVFNERKFGPLLPRITILDGTVARITIGKPEVENEEDYLTLWTESKVFSQMLKTHFMNIWRDSEPIERYIKRSKP